MNAQAQQEYDALVSQLRANPTEYEGHPLLEWDVYRLERHILDTSDPNIVTEIRREVWVSIQVAVAPVTAPPGTPGLGGKLIDRHWPASDIVMGTPKAPDWQPASQGVPSVTGEGAETPAGNQASDPGQPPSSGPVGTQAHGSGLTNSVGPSQDGGAAPSAPVSGPVGKKAST